MTDIVSRLEENLKIANIKLENNKNTLKKMHQKNALLSSNLINIESQLRALLLLIKPGEPSKLSSVAMSKLLCQYFLEIDRTMEKGIQAFQIGTLRAESIEGMLQQIFAIMLNQSKKIKVLKGSL